MSELSNDTKKHTTKSRETIPLSISCAWLDRKGGMLCNFLRAQVDMDRSGIAGRIWSDLFETAGI
jgi:hypothetical protein